MDIPTQNNFPSDPGGINTPPIQKRLKFKKSSLRAGLIALSLIIFLTVSIAVLAKNKDRDLVGSLAQALRVKPILRELGLIKTSSVGFFEALETQDLAYDFNGDGVVTGDDYSILVDKETRVSAENIETTTTTTTTTGSSDIPTEAQFLPTVKGFSTSTFDGSATISYPIGLPSGPTGLNPSLSLNYSSSAVDDLWTGTETKWRNDPTHPYQKQAPEAGLGWSLSGGGSIYRDTMDSQNNLDDDRFSISFGGGSAKLVPVGSGAHDLAYVEYKTIPDLFLKVERWGQPNWYHWRYHWTVTDGSGTVYQFGNLPQTGWRQDFDPSDLDKNLATWYKLDATRPWMWNGDDKTVEQKWNLVKAKDIYGKEINYTWGLNKVRVTITNLDCPSWCPNCTGCGTRLCDNGETCAHECKCTYTYKDYAAGTWINKISWGDINEVEIIRQSRLDYQTHLKDDTSERLQKNNLRERVSKIIVRKKDPQGVFQPTNYYLLNYIYAWNPTKHKDDGDGIAESGEIVAGQVVHSLLTKITQFSGGQDPDANNDGIIDTGFPLGTNSLPSYKFSYTKLRSFTTTDSDSQTATENDYFLTTADNGQNGRVEFEYWNNSALKVKICNRTNSCLQDQSYNSQRHRVSAKKVYDGMGYYTRETYDYGSVDYGLAAVERLPKETSGTACTYCSPGSTCNSVDCGEYGCHTFQVYNNNYFCHNCPGGESNWLMKEVCKLNQSGSCESGILQTCECKCSLVNEPATDFEFMGYPQVTTEVYEKALVGSAPGAKVAKTTSYYKQAMQNTTCFKPSPLKGVAYKTDVYSVATNNVYSTSESTYCVNFYVDGKKCTQEELDIYCNNGYRIYEDIYVIQPQESRNKINLGTGLCTKTGVSDYDSWNNPQKSTVFGETNCDASWSDKVTTDNKYSITLYTSANTTKHILPKVKETWSSNSSSLTPTASTAFNHSKIYYDGLSLGQIGNYGRVTKSEVWKDNVLYANSTVAYEDSVGRPWNVKSATDALGNTTTTTYESIYNMYPKTVTNAKGQATTTTYDFENAVSGHPNNGWQLGLPIKVEDANGQAIHSTYDVFGRPLNTYLPGRSITSNPNQQQGYFYFNSNDASTGGFTCNWTNHCIDNLGMNNQPKMMVQSLALMKDEGTLGNRSVTRTFYNGLGQNVQAQQSWLYGDVINTGIPVAGEGKKDVLVSQNYNALGQVYQSSQSYTASPYVYLINGLQNSASPYITPSWTSLLKITTAFDGLGRPRIVTYPDGSSEETVYDVDGNPLKTKSLDKNCKAGLPCTEKISTNDAFGQMAQIQEVEKNVSNAKTYTTKYQYHPILGALESVTDTNNVAVNQIQYDKLGRKTQMTDKDMGLWKYDYDKLGQLTWQEDPNNRVKGQAIKLSYDELGRLIKKDLITTNNSLIKNLLTYGYDSTANGNTGIGRKTSFATPNRETVTYIYNARGQLIKTAQNITGLVDNLITETTYDEGGRTVTTKYPAFGNLPSETVTTKYVGPYAVGLLGTKPYVKEGSVSYNKDGQVMGLEYGNTVTQSYNYNLSNLRLQQAETKKGTNVLLGASYTYDKVGNITTMTDLVRPKTELLSLTQKFTYDPLYRLITANTTDGWNITNTNYVGTYSYDDVGNILKKYESTVRSGIVENQNVDLTYSTDNYHRPGSVSINGSNAGYSYDANGNLKSDGLRSYDYDDEGRLIKVTVLPNVGGDPVSTTTPTPTTGLTTTPTPTTGLTSTPTPTLPASLSCTVSLTPSTYTLKSNKSVGLTSAVTTTGGATVNRVVFSSSNTLLTVSPTIDYSYPYQTTATTGTIKSKATVTVTAKVYLNNTTNSCSATSKITIQK